MGALHRGHISLLERAKRENDVSVASIFVNPLQFNDKKDLENYPRTLEQDIEKLVSCRCDFLFTPSAEEMYGKHFSNKIWNNEFTVFDLGHLDKVMEGKYRPGHFQGVCTVVKKLFDIVKPDKAYFGEKDFQQLVIIRYMVKALGLPLEIISCPTVRESDGLAMSSRNMLLNSEERKNAAHIAKTLFAVKEKYKSIAVSDLKKWVEEKISENPFLHLEYFEIVDSETLLPIQSWEGSKSPRACIAVKIGTIRLIDNICLENP
jgi:pantoate--beta-alanine ligase